MSEKKKQKTALGLLRSQLLHRAALRWFATIS